MTATEQPDKVAEKVSLPTLTAMVVRWPLVDLWLARFSTTTNTISAANEHMKATTVGADSRPHVGARSNVNVNKPIPIVMSASPVRSMRHRLVEGLGDAARADGDRDERQRHVQPEDPAPPDRLGEQSADQGSRRIAQSG